MYIEETLREALRRHAEVANPEDVEWAERWVKRVTILLEWIAQHPHLVEIQNEASALLQLYRGEAVPEKAAEEAGETETVARARQRG
ncbi:MAG: hypothetical protein KatS3mg076_3134 [Candidatus Binatia bacterium]|nr:MAG: hypothetical protein KatS3mg076_3134 [Candidatus Binatia bacterium]